MSADPLAEMLDHHWLAQSVETGKAYCTCGGWEFDAKSGQHSLPVLGEVFRPFSEHIAARLRASGVRVSEDAGLPAAGFAADRPTGPRTEKGHALSSRLRTRMPDAEVDWDAWIRAIEDAAEAWGKFRGMETALSVPNECPECGHEAHSDECPNRAALRSTPAAPQPDTARPGWADEASWTAGLIAGRSEGDAPQPDPICLCGKPANEHPTGPQRDRYDHAFEAAPALAVKRDPRPDWDALARLVDTAIRRDEITASRGAEIMGLRLQTWRDWVHDLRALGEGEKP